MSRLALPSILLLGSLLPAQQNDLDELRAQNQKLQRTVQRQQAKIRQLQKMVAAQNVKEANDKENADAAEKMKQAKIAAEKARLAAQMEAKARVKAQARRAQVLVRRNFRLAPARPAPRNPMLKGDYKKTLDALSATYRKLTKIQDPKEARKAVDTLTTQIHDVRKALWELQKASKAAADKGK